MSSTLKTISSKLKSQDKSLRASLPSLPPSVSLIHLETELSKPSTACTNLEPTLEFSLVTIRSQLSGLPVKLVLLKKEAKTVSSLEQNSELSFKNSWIRRKTPLKEATPMNSRAKMLRNTSRTTSRREPRFFTELRQLLSTCLLQP